MWQLMYILWDNQSQHQGVVRKAKLFPGGFEKFSHEFSGPKLKIIQWKEKKYKRTHIEILNWKQLTYAIKINWLWRETLLNFMVLLASFSYIFSYIFSLKELLVRWCALVNHKVAEDQCRVALDCRLIVRYEIIREK